MPSSSGRAWWAAVLMLGAAVATPVTVGVLSVELQDDLRIGNRALGLYLTAFWACTALAAVTGGRRMDRIAWRPAAGLGLAACLLGQLGIAASRSIGWFVACLAVTGLAYGVIAPTSNVVVVREIPVQRHGVALGAKQSVAPVAGIVAGLAVPLVALTVGWRWVFVLVAVVPLAALAASWPPAGRRWREPVWSTPAPARAGAAPAGEPARLSLARIAVAAGLATLSVGVLTTFSLRTLTAVGLSASAAGLVVAGSSAAALVGRILAGWWTDKRGSDGLGPATAMIAVGAVGMALMATPVRTLTLLGTVLAFCGAWGWPALLLLGVLTHHAGRAAAASGRFQLGTAMGAATGPPLFAAIGDAAGLPLAWLTVAGLTAVSAGLVAAAARRRGSTPAVQPG